MTDAHRELTLKLAKDEIVMLRNRNQILQSRLQIYDDMVSIYRSHAAPPPEVNQNDSLFFIGQELKQIEENRRQQFFAEKSTSAASDDGEDYGYDTGKPEQPLVPKAKVKKSVRRKK